ncbi:hypothetical protein [Haloarcula sp. JP-L23]|uniref:hypothetical protein n=1 Tax=Haloarcula sp. JP-L23 TaxID=2716717 RepID=UPI00140EF7B1|nr:hypothetical protein G9465_25210 [Haloarcula sp. JP-L23]
MFDKINKLTITSKLTELGIDADTRGSGCGSQPVATGGGTGSGMIPAIGDFRHGFVRAIDGIIQRFRQLADTCISKWGTDPTKATHTVMTDGGRESYLLPHDERLSQLNTITQTTRANLIQNMLGHRWMMPSKSELDYYNQSKSAGTISGHLDKLIDADIAMRIVMPQGKGTRDGPSAFFTLTDEGYATLEHHALFVPDLDEIRSDHARVEKTDEIIEDENAHRPTILVEYDHPLKGDGRSVVDPCEYAADFDEWTKQASSDDCDDEQQEPLPGV